MCKNLVIFLSLFLIFSCSSGSDQLETEAKKEAKTVEKATEDSAEVVEETAKNVGDDVTEPELDEVNFAFDSYQISSKYNSGLDRLAKYLNDAKFVKISIAGHCDNRGTKDYNLILGEKRALAVKKYLVSKNVSASRISTISYGEEKPIRLGNTEADHRANRRAEINLK